jgi:hypothetical protein
MVRLSRYDADVRAIFARSLQLFHVTFTNVNWLTPTVLPVSYDCGSVVAVEPVMLRERLRRLSRLEPPLSAAYAMALRHTLIVAKP